MSRCSSCCHLVEGECRRNPPMMLGLAQGALAGQAPTIVGGWPRVLAPDKVGCGEHRASLKVAK